MQLSDEHDGIIELSSGEVGQKFVDWLSENKPSKVDPIIEIAITPNRPDALGVHGIARDLAARGLGKLILNKVSSVQVVSCPISVKIEMIPVAHWFFRTRYQRGEEWAVSRMAARLFESNWVASHIHTC